MMLKFHALVVYQRQRFLIERKWVPCSLIQWLMGTFGVLLKALAHASGFDGLVMRMGCSFTLFCDSECAQAERNILIGCVLWLIVRSSPIFTFEIACVATGEDMVLRFLPFIFLNVWSLPPTLFGTTLNIKFDRVHIFSVLYIFIFCLY